MPTAGQGPKQRRTGGIVIETNRDKESSIETKRRKPRISVPPWLPLMVILYALAISYVPRSVSGVSEQVEFKAGGISSAEKPYRDTFVVSLDQVQLGKDWKEYEINFSGQDLSNVIGAFAWVGKDYLNPAGLTFYFDDVRYEG